MVLSTVLGILLKRIIPLIVLLLAIFVGWLNTFEMAMPVFFTVLYTTSKGYMPPLLVGRGFDPCPVPEIPVEEYSVAPTHTTEGDGDAGAIISLSQTFLTLQGTNDLLPQIGIGMCCRYTAYDYESVKRTTLWYLLLGGRHIDTAQMYMNHEPIGDAIKEATSGKYGISRSDIFVTTKVYPGFYGYNSTLDIIPRFLEELQLGYIDLVLLHMPSPTIGGMKIANSDCYSKENKSHSECRIESWKALITSKENGNVRNIGVSNFQIHQLDEFKSAGLFSHVAVNQIPYNPWIIQQWREVYDYCQENNVVVIAYGSFMGTALQTETAFSQQTIQAISNTYNRTSSQILLRWSIQKGNAVIPGTGNPKHMKENLDVFQFTLSDVDMKRIDDLQHDTSVPPYEGMPPDAT